MTTEREPRTEAGPTDLVWRKCVCGAWYWGVEQSDDDRAHGRGAEAARETLEQVRRAVEALPMYQNAGAGVTTTETTTRRLREYRAAVLATIEEASR